MSVFPVPRVLSCLFHLFYHPENDMKKIKLQPFTAPLYLYTKGDSLKIPKRFPSCSVSFNPNHNYAIDCYLLPQLSKS